MSTLVPSPTFGSTGYVVPATSDILAGVQGDQIAALGSSLSTDLTTPQGQLASSQAAIIAEAFDSYLAITQNIDPAYASGRMQDAIGRLYNMTRIPAQSTVVTLTCSGLDGTAIPINAKAQDVNGNIYYCTEYGIISGGSVSLTFACGTTGAIAAPANSVNSIYQAIPGWDSVNNLADGVMGRAVESRSEFEYRRQKSVAANSNGQVGSILGAVLAVDGVLDAYAYENTLDVASGSIFSGSIAGSVLTVASVASGSITVGDTLVYSSGTSVVSGTIITKQLTGTTGGVGTYTVSISQTSTSFTGKTAWGGIQINPHSIYVAAYGGNASDIATAIFNKKNPGCGYNGNTTVSVTDPNPAYSHPPTYSVRFQIPTPTPILFAVSMQSNANLPTNATAQVQTAIIAAFNGSDGGSRARIASPLFASRFYAGVAGLGSWALVYSILLGIDAATLNSVQVRMDQIPTISAANISVTFS